MKDKTIKISAEPHFIIKEYCNKNGLKLARFIESACLQHIREASKDDRREENL